MFGLMYTDSKARVISTPSDRTYDAGRHSGTRNTRKAKERCDQEHLFAGTPTPTSRGWDVGRTRRNGDHLSCPKGNFTNQTNRVTCSKTNNIVHKQKNHKFGDISSTPNAGVAKPSAPTMHTNLSLPFPSQHFPIPQNTDFPSRDVQGVSLNPTHEKKKGKGGTG